MMEPGEQAPEFEVPHQDGRPVRLSDLRGRRVVLYFYPKAGIPVPPVARTDEASYRPIS